VDAHRFDALTRRLAAARVPRRAFAAVAASLGGAALVPVLDAAEAAKRGRKRRRKRRKKRGCGAGKVRCNGACVKGDCCTAGNCGASGHFCADNHCTCFGGDACGGGRVCRLGCCIPQGRSDQGFASNCCSQVSVAGTCQCVPNGEDDQQFSANCCSGSSVGSLCCIRNGQSDGGDDKDCCSQSSPNGTCACRATGETAGDHPATCCTGFSDGAACVVVADPPAVCTQGAAGVVRGLPWVVCRADADSAWLSSTSKGGGEVSAFDALAACAALGYGGVGDFGGTTLSVCGSNQPTASCANPGTETYGSGAYVPSDDYNCGGPGIICNTVMWECLA
jgi:hypothetical protein